MRPGAQVRIYSDFVSKKHVQQKTSETFDDFLAQGYTLRLNTDLLEAWSEMITADVLIMSKSSFSFVPALLSQGSVVYYPMWHAPLPDFYRLECSRNVTVSEDHCRHIEDRCVRWEEAANLCRVVRCSETVCPVTEIPEGQHRRRSLLC